MKNLEYLGILLKFIRNNLMIKLCYDLRNNASFLLRDFFEFVFENRSEIFENEEKLLSIKENFDAVIEKEKDFFKDKPFDMSCKFLGTLADKKNKPW